MYLNRVFIIGNLTKDPELKALEKSGMKVATFSVATNKVWRDKGGEKKESVEFHNIVVFGKMAETTAQYMKKGSQILIEGRIQTRQWEYEGKKQYRTEIIADAVQFGQKPADAQARQLPKTPEKIGNTEIDYPEDEINPDDIPF